MKRYRLVPDFDSPNKLFIYDTKDGKRVVAIFYDIHLANLTVNFMNETEEQLQGY